MPAPHVSSLVGQTVLGEYRLEKLVREDSALAVFAATSAVDGGPFTVLLALEVSVDTPASDLEASVERAGRHAVGVRGLYPLLHARPVAVGDRTRLGVVRRGEPGDGFAGLLAHGPRTAAEVARLLTPLAETLGVLHDQGMVHGAVCPSTVLIRGGDLFLDAFGLSMVAETADGARGARDVLAPSYRPPELADERPSPPGPWSDVYGLGLLAIELLSGTSLEGWPPGQPPTSRALGLTLPARVHDLFERILAPSAARRPLPIESALRELGATAHDALPPPEDDPVDGPVSAAPFSPPGSLFSAPPGDRSPASPAALPKPPSPPAPPAGGELGARPPAAASPWQSPLAAPVESTQGRLLGWLIGVALALFAVGTIGAIAYVVTRPAGLSPPVAAPVIAATAPPSAAAPPGLAAPPPAGPVTPARTAGAATYPADQAALVPIEPDAVLRGDRDALLTVVLFGDLTCPFTAQMLLDLPTLEARYGGDLRFVLRFFPIPGRPDAIASAEAAAAIWGHGQPDLFWSFLAQANASPNNLDAARLEELSVKTGLPAGLVADAIARNASKARIDRDIGLGRRLAVRGTPVVFFNGRQIDGFQPTAALEPFLDAELRRARQELARGVPREKLYAARVTANLTTAEGEKKPTSSTGGP